MPRPNARTAVQLAVAMASKGVL
ncbi:hypothetical protein NC653_007084 [Populus alba x Populus x berolinensis]|uniref:Uncharacterized protein n=1 Tax=Populus alba x Populus x berolinensis TaxID=444605 RepID=A0AAD6WDF6_9ROSI|nr:hypothetical protein NC653_007084 [Populus alba x Populus x berolinensis]